MDLGDSFWDSLDILTVVDGFKGFFQDFLCLSGDSLRCFRILKGFYWSLMDLRDSLRDSLEILWVVDGFKGFFSGFVLLLWGFFDMLQDSSGILMVVDGFTGFFQDSVGRNGIYGILFCVVA